MIRPITLDDKAELIALANDALGFEPNELEELAKMFADYFNGNRDDICITDDDNGLVGVAYCTPERMTNGTWNLLLIAIHPNYQGQGRGSALVRYVEQTLTGRGERVLLVEIQDYPVLSAHGHFTANVVMMRKREFVTSTMSAVTKLFIVSYFERFDGLICSKSN